MIYNETKLPKYAVPVLIVLILFIYLPGLATLPLTRTEALAALLAKYAGTTTGHGLMGPGGMPVAVYPMQPLLIRA
ncbi:MAG: hypothetical protein K9N51_04040, partial [Candidatus Pacebacteria bacterium]|nr:hypothetical protein [Candidatus Paceibacterota bacterium]